MDAITSTSWGNDAYKASETPFLRARIYSHGRVKRASRLMVALNTRTTSQDFGNVELANCPFSVVDLSSTADGGSLCPVIRFFRQTLFVKIGYIREIYQRLRRHSRESSSVQQGSFSRTTGGVGRCVNGDWKFWREWRAHCAIPRWWEASSPKETCFPYQAVSLIV